MMNVNEPSRNLSVTFLEYGPTYPALSAVMGNARGTGLWLSLIRVYHYRFLSTFRIC